MHGGHREERLPDVGAGKLASDRDRERVVARLRVAAGDGVLGLDELEERLAATYAARTLPELTPITADLPVATGDHDQRTGRVAHRRPLVLEDDEFRGHLTVYSLVIGMLIGIWLLGGAGHFWPFYPAAGWGIGLGAHYQRAVTHQRKRLAKARSLGLTLAELDEHEAQERKARRRELGQKVRREVTRTVQSHRGPPEREPAPSTSRQYVVALFVDVVNSTSLNEALGDERWLSVRRAYRALVDTCVSNHGGWEANSSGDGVLARFEHPEAATRAAVELLRRLEERRRETGFAPSVRVGIHSGDAMDEDGDIIGTVVNLAARVTDAADVDEILVTEHVADHLESGFRTSGRGLHTLKGISRPRHLLAVEWR